MTTARWASQFAVEHQQDNEASVEVLGHVGIQQRLGKTHALAYRSTLVATTQGVATKADGLCIAV